MARIEITQGGITYLEIPAHLIEDDELLKTEMEGLPIPPEFKIGAWLADEVIGETALAARLFRKELAFVLMHDRRGRAYRSHTEVGDEDQIVMPVEAQDCLNGPLKPLFLHHCHLPHDDTHSPLEGFSSDMMYGDWYNMFCYTRDFGNPLYSVARSNGFLWVAQRSEAKYQQTAVQFFEDRGLPVPSDVVDCYTYQAAREGLTSRGVTTVNKTIEERCEINRGMALLRGFNLYIVDLNTRHGQQVD